MTAERRLRELGIDLPPPRPASANFVRAKQVGNILYVSGMGRRVRMGVVSQGRSDRI
jgi:hypothetical protein